MGSRAVIQVTQSTSPTSVFFYTHWEGDFIAQHLARGIHKAAESGRLLDESYATRIIFDTLTGREDSSTGFGICIGEAPSDVQYETPHIFWDSFRGEPKVSYMGIVHEASTFADFFDPLPTSASV